MTSTTSCEGSWCAFGNRFEPTRDLQALSWWLKAIVTGTADDLTIGSIAYNPASQIVSKWRSNDGEVHPERRRRRRRRAWNGHYNVSRPYTANGLNQLTASGTTVPTYDGRGNLTRAEPTAGDPIYAYDGLNRLVTTGATSLGHQAATLAYDPLLRLTQIATVSTTSRFAYDGLAMIAEYDANNVVKRRFVHGPGTDEPLVQYDGTGLTTRRWLHADERGSIVAMTDSTGTAIARNRYDEYGIPAASNAGRFL